MSIYLFISLLFGFFCFSVVRSLLEFLFVGVSLYAHFQGLQQTFYKAMGHMYITYLVDLSSGGTTWKGLPLLNQNLVAQIAQNSRHPTLPGGSLS